MEAIRSISFTVILLLALGMVVSPVFAGESSSGNGNPGGENCADCHAGPAGDIKTAGGRHRNVPCLGCHLGRHGTASQRLQSCNRCHLKTKRAHFRFDNCLGCHRNPHTPLNISFKDIKGICLNCHAEQVAQLRDNRSRHSALECSACHDVHRKFPECTRCHTPHAADMASSECRKCHNAHMPKSVTYADDLPSKDCGACHGSELDLLAASSTKHEALACVFCHRQKHRMMPACQNCHGSPHPEGIMAKFPRCGGCHKSAHDLNNWPETRPEVSREEVRLKK